MQEWRTSGWRNSQRLDHGRLTRLKSRFLQWPGIMPDARLIDAILMHRVQAVSLREKEFERAGFGLRQTLAKFPLRGKICRSTALICSR